MFKLFQGEAIHKVLQIYLVNNESTSDLLNELACSVLPEVSVYFYQVSYNISHYWILLEGSRTLAIYWELKLVMNMRSNCFVK